ncbi:MAG: hypothetical protein WKF41_15325 [Gaiellaceae bacterium]
MEPPAARTRGAAAPRSLSVFRGGCTLEAAEEVCEAELDTLQSLVDKSLVRVRDGERFWMLETIREYAAERLEQSDEGEELWRRHAEHLLELARELPPPAPVEKEWLDNLDREHDNIRAALDRLPAQGGQNSRSTWRSRSGASGRCAATSQRDGADWRRCSRPSRARPRPAATR